MLPLFVRATLFAATTTTLGAPTLRVNIEPTMTAEERSQLLSACSNAYAAARCVDAASTPREDASLFGRVESEEPQRVLVEVTLAHEHGNHSASRELAFVPEDEPLERAKAIGLTLGVVAAGMLENAPPSPPPPQTDSSTAPPEAEATPRWLVSLLGGVGRDPDFSTFEWGLAGRVELGSATSRYRLRAGLTGFRAQDDALRLTLTRLDPTLGVGSSFALGPLEGGVALDVGMEWLSASVSDGSTTHGDDASRITPLLRANLGLRSFISRDFGIELDGQTSFTTSRTEIFVRGTDVSGTSGLQWALLAGGFVVLGD